jgi:hypothetical protein
MATTEENNTMTEEGFMTPERGPFNSPVLPPINRHRFNPEEDFYPEEDDFELTPHRIPLGRMLDFAATTENVHVVETREEPDTLLRALPNQSHLEQIDPTFLFKYMSAKTSEEKMEVVSRTYELYEILQQVRRFLKEFNKEDADDLQHLGSYIEKMQEYGLVWTPEYFSAFLLRDAL